MSMKIKYKFIALVLFAITCSFNANAQVYNSAIGLRVGYPLSISYKKNTSDTKAYEIFGGIRPFTGYNELRLNGALQIHSDIGDSGYFRWYYGAGAGVAMYTFPSNSSRSGGASLTLSGYLGLELTLKELPVNLTLDWVPTLYVGGYGSGLEVDMGHLQYDMCCRLN